MTREEAISVLNMVEAHGALVIEAKKMAIEALKQPERKKGRWVDYPIADGCLQCSCCGVLRMGEPSNFCPNCGAKMEEKE